MRKKVVLFTIHPYRPEIYFIFQFKKVQINAVKKKKGRKERSRKDGLKTTEHLIKGFCVFVSFLYTLLLLQICSRYKLLEILYPDLTD